MAASIINTNVMSMNAQGNLNKNSLSLATSLERLSSGLRVNSAKDDAAGLAVAMGLQATISGYSVKIRNAADDISTAQKSDGEASVIGDVLQRMNELAVQAQGTNGLAEASKLQVEYDKLDTFQAAFTDGTSVGGKLSASGSAIKIESKISGAKGALGTLAGKRAGYGATIATEEFKIQNFENARMNDAAARSRIMDADFAMETANLARGQILMQAGTAMVAQANQIPQNVLSLLR